MNKVAQQCNLSQLVFNVISAISCYVNIGMSHKIQMHGSVKTSRYSNGNDCQHRRVTPLLRALLVASGEGEDWTRPWSRGCRVGYVSTVKCASTNVPK